jgi:ribosomal protein S17E
MRRSIGLVTGLFLSLTLVVACSKEAPKETPTPAPTPPPAPVAAPPAAPAGDAGAGDAAPKKSKLAPAPTDGLSLAERMERRKASDAKLAAQLAADERQRLLDYDKTKVKLHQEVFAFIQATRKALDGAKNKAAVDKLQEKQSKAIVATGKKLQTIDPKGGNSNVVTDYDVMLNSLANDYPQALSASFEGDKAALEEQRAELDKRTKKVEEWIALLKPGKAGKAVKGKKK